MTAWSYPKTQFEYQSWYHLNYINGVVTKYSFVCLCVQWWRMKFAIKTFSRNKLTPFGFRRNCRMSDGGQRRCSTCLSLDTLPFSSDLHIQRLHDTKLSALFLRVQQKNCFACNGFQICVRYQKYEYQTYVSFLPFVELISLDRLSVKIEQRSWTNILINILWLNKWEILLFSTCCPIGNGFHFM